MRAVARRQACAQVHLATGAVNRLTVRRPWPGVRVSSWTISPGVADLRPLGGRLAWGRRRRSARGDLRRSAGTGETAPFSTSLLRMRRSRRRPYRRSRTAILALPHVGWPARASRAAFTSAGGQAGRRWGRRDARRPRRLRQRETLPALAAACAVKPPARACRQRSRASRPCAAPRNMTGQAEGGGLLQTVRTNSFGSPLLPFNSSVSHMRELGQQDVPPTAISAKASNQRENLSRTSRRKGWGLRFTAVEPCMPTATQAFFELAGQVRSAATSRAAPEANLRTRSDKKRSRLPGCPPLAPDVPRPPETRQPLLLRQRRPGGARRLERRTTALRRQRHRERRGAGPETGVERRGCRPRRSLKHRRPAAAVECAERMERAATGRRTRRPPSKSMTAGSSRRPLLLLEARPPFRRGSTAGSTTLMEKHSRRRRSAACGPNARIGRWSARRATRDDRPGFAARGRPGDSPTKMAKRERLSP